MTSVAGHGAITLPAMRHNAFVNFGYCPYCQGDQVQCDNRYDVSNCTPPHPCWGAQPGLTVPPLRFGSRLAHQKHPDGSYWIDPSGGRSDRPLWCPGDKMPIRYYING